MKSRTIRNIFLAFKCATIVTLFFFTATNTQAQKERKQAVNICAVAIPVMNFYVVNYEYLYHQRHGLAARIEYAPTLNGAGAEGVAWAGVLNYRWHFTPELKKFFAGPYARYRYVYGSGTAGITQYDFNVPELNLGLNGGYRWISKIGFNVVISAGYGYSWGKDKLSPASEGVTGAFNDFKKANGTNEVILDAPFYGEFSIGYAF